MKTNKWILGGLMAMAITACTSDELVENTNPTQGRKVTVTAYAPGDEANSRVSFADDNTSTVTLSWKEGDKFSVVCGTNVETFSKTAEDNTFSGDLPTPATSLASCYAFYPALEEEETTLTAANTVPFDLSTQTGALDESKTYMRASSTDGLTYNFVHCTAILKATFANILPGAKISQVMVKTSHADSQVDGNLNLATGEISGGSKNTITIKYTTTTAVDARTPVYIYLPPMDAEKKALAFEVITTDGNTYTGTLGASTPQPIDGESSNANQGQGIEAGNLYAASVQMEAIPYITFTTIGEQVFKLNKVYSGNIPSTFQYSADGGTWTDYTIGNSVPFNTNLRLRGTGNDKGTSLESSISSEFYSVLYHYISFANDNVPVSCSGDIRTLIDWTNYKVADTKNARFASLFRNCKALKEVSDLILPLDGESMATYCYHSMFYLSGLTSVPELPATTLATGCYSYMFAKCFGLTTLPVNMLPATQLANNCYEYMFYDSGLTSLRSDLLPASTLKEYCYQGMFSECASLQTLPNDLLPATGLANYCYEKMFKACSNLTTVPKLPAMTLAGYCYEKMFENCDQLAAVPNNLLPATTLASYCYSEMFINCNALTKAPDLPAMTMAEYCYNRMFQGCSELVTAPALPATTLADFCYKWMFGGCTKLTTAPVLPATTLKYACYSNMFSGCTELTTAPVLPATILADFCYSNMFNGCVKLNSVTMLGKRGVYYWSSISECLDNWLKGVSSTGTLYKDPGLQIGTEAPQIQKNSEDGIPSGWTVNDVTQPIGLPGINNGGVFDDTNQPI